jgi:hypothetical protein
MSKRVWDIATMAGQMKPTDPGDPSEGVTWKSN